MNGADVFVAGDKLYKLTSYRSKLWFSTSINNNALICNCFYIILLYWAFIKLWIQRVYSIYKMISQNYNTRQNSLASNENCNPETSELIINLESKLLLSFDNLEKEMLNLNDVIIRYLQVENQRLRNKINSLEEKVISLEENTIP